MGYAYVIDAIRTPIGKYGGALSSTRPDDLLAHVIKSLVNRNVWLDLSLIEEVIAGDANQAGEDNRNVARMAALLAGLPVSVAGVTVNRLCASGLQAIIDAARSIQCEQADIVLAGGVESMSRAPYVMLKPTGITDRNPQIADTTLGWRFTNQLLASLYHPFSMGETAENVAEHWKISREDQDRFALQSQEKYFQAMEKGLFSDEIVAIQVKGVDGLQNFEIDEHPRRTSLEKLASLKPAFRENGTVTAGNSTGINDGASVLLLVSEQIVQQYALQPLARVRSMAVAGVDPAVMGIGPVPATKKILQRTGLEVSDLDLIELNEAFASQSIACMRQLGLEQEIVNVNGGSIALGHPLGCSGARISTTLLHEMRRRSAKRGLATMCVGVGQGAAILYERV